MILCSCDPWILSTLLYWHVQNYWYFNILSRKVSMPDIKASNHIFSKAITVIHNSRNHVDFSCPPRLGLGFSDFWLHWQSWIHLITLTQNTAWSTKRETRFSPIMCHLFFHHCDITYWHLEIGNLNRVMFLSDLTCKECFMINNLSGSTKTTVHYDMPG